ncbi:unnamed protein product [Kuraishia capsulata CBS 1993]|uniref:Uncharacterized protein n=1 Tax=Kuraishia capsulata CBS 1993 TaxID=1382522 RepID=W6MPX2_9ASCO|nr:uncharacterized protein KUCA_T00003225001 [Kuraishia capsulata CBS 1993]CDK27247.1 unnamed protein product [Kuraishia capsulata CBS 1993]
MSTQNSVSLLKPTSHDQIDAHSNGEQEVVYRRLLAEATTSEKYASGRTKRPWIFEVVQGFFLQDDEGTDDLTFEYVNQDFGLKLSSWTELRQKLESLNSNAASNESYKLLFLARHGQGYHNFAVEKYGTEKWDRDLAHLSGDGEIVWGPDPFLTSLGEAQADENHDVWLQQIAKGAPIPTAFYSSPFTRSMHTLIRTWKDIVICENGQDESKLLAPRAHPLVVEDVRETIGLHLCDKRSTKSTIIERVSKYGLVIEDGFEEEDVLYKEDWRESLSEQALRINKFLQFLFEKDFVDNKITRDGDLVVNVTSHAGTIRSFITALGHRHFTISTGGMIPVVVKAIRQL